MLAHRDRDRRQLGDLVALGRGGVNALILAEEVARRAAALGPVLDDLIDLFERKRGDDCCPRGRAERPAPGPRPLVRPRGRRGRIG